MSDEQKMPDVIYLDPESRDYYKSMGYADFIAADRYKKDKTIDATIPYLRCPDNVDPSTIAKGLADMATTIATLAAENERMRELIAEMRDDLCVLSHKPEFLDTINRADAILDNKENNNNG